MNIITDYYKKNGVDTSMQTIDDYNEHLKRRIKLYRQLGMPPYSFKNAKILEAGCGCGVNALALIEMGGYCDLVDPNEKAISNLKELYDLRKVNNNQYNVYQKEIESLADNNETYDIVIAENFVHAFAPNKQKEIIDLLKDKVVIGGVCVITCMDFIGIYLETVKRLIGVEISKGYTSFDEKMSILIDVFEPQLRCLRGVSRSTDEWMTDNILSPYGLNGSRMSIEDAIKMFGEDYSIMGTSPHMFTDYSWYKDVYYDVKCDYIKQFNRKRLSFLLAGMPEVILEEEMAIKLVNEFDAIKIECVQYEKSLNKEYIKNIQSHIKEIDKHISLFPIEFKDVFEDTQKVFNDILCNKTIKATDYNMLFPAFGRGLQYISFLREK